jgi:hypothetical protein
MTGDPPPTDSLLYGNRKFYITAFMTIAGSAALFAGKLGDASYVTLMTVILSIYGAANIVDKKLGGAG